MNSNIVCPLCSSGRMDIITDKVRFGKKANVYKCGDCSLVFVDQKSFSFPTDFYEKEYHQTYLTHVEPDALNPDIYYEKMKKANRIWADKFCDMLTGRETVLDMGCSTGHFIDMVKHKTKKIYGYDLNTKEIDFCISRGLDVSGKPLKESFKDKTFDYITLIYVLEHIADPKSFLLSIKPFLKRSGKLIILVPNVRDALIGFYDIPEFKDFYYCIEHLFYYSPATIRLLFESVGLKGEIETIQEYPLTNHLSWIYRRAPSNVLASRAGIPDVALTESTRDEEWNQLWKNFNNRYVEFLGINGFGDRIWCSVGFED